jgi:Icc-related predicted phosphoesterase
MLTDKLPPADFIFHCGDFSMGGTVKEYLDFIQWLSSLDQYKHKVFIAGNHDMILENGGSWRNRKEDLELKQLCIDIARKLNVTYLDNSSCQIMGLHIYGSPNSPTFCGWGFPMKDFAEEVRVYSKIPEHTDILLTHCPPKYLLDIGGRKNANLGSRGLQQRVVQVMPKVHCFGHIHESFGQAKFLDTLYINASYCGIPYNRFNSFVKFEVEV